MTLNFPDSPSTGDIYDDSTSGFRYEWNGTVWISTDPARAANIKELDDISSGFNGSTTQFNLTVSSSAVEPVSDAQILISVGGVMQNPTNDYTVSGSTITFTTAPSAGLTFFGVFLGQALSLNTVQDGTVEFASFKTGTAGVGIQSAGSQIGVGITNLNFIGTGNTFVAIGNTVNVSVNVGGIDTTGTSYFNNITASGNINVTGDLTYDEVTAVNQKISGVTTTTGLDVLGISSVKDLRSVGVTTLTSAGITNLTVSAGSTFNGNVDLGNASSDTITATGRFDSDIVPSTDNARDLGASGLEFKDLYIDGTANIDALAADSAAIGDLTSGRVTYAGSSGELQDSGNLTFDGTDLTAASAKISDLTNTRVTYAGASGALQDNAGLTFDGTTLAATRLAAPVAFTTSLTAANVDVTGITTIRDDFTLKGASANITFDKSTDDLIFEDGAQAIFGTSSDGLEILHDGSNSYIKDGGTGDLIINANTIRLKNAANSEHLAIFDQNNYVSLYYDDTKRFETTSVGVNVVGNVDCDSLNNAGISTFGSTTTFGDTVTIQKSGAADLQIGSTDAGGARIFLDGDSNGDFSGSDYSFIQHNTSGNLVIRANSPGTAQLLLQVGADGDYGAMFTEGGSALLRWDNSTKIETTSVGVNITGNVDCDSINNAGISTFSGNATFGGNIDLGDNTSGNASLRLGNSQDFFMNHNGTDSYIINNTGDLYIRDLNGDVHIQGKDAEESIVAKADNGVQIYFNNSKKIETMNTGVAVVGVMSATTYSGDGSGLSGVGASLAAWNYQPPLYGSDVSQTITGIGITYSTFINAGSGSITLRETNASGTSVQTWTNSQISRDGNKFTGSLDDSLKQDQLYHLDIPAGFFTDPNGSNSVGLAYTFNTSPQFYALYTWGDNTGQAKGNLGQGNETKYSSPTQVPGLTWQAVSQGSNQHVLATKNDGTFWSWGKNAYGQLGLNNRTYTSSPQQIPGTTWGTDITQFSSATFLTLAVRTDGTLWSCGRNEHGQLGHNNTTTYSSPRQVGSDTTWRSVGTSHYSSYATKTDGTLWAWGQNTRGKLGQNNTTNYSSPRQIPGTTWSTVSGRGGTTAVGAIKTDGTLWVWGDDDDGTLGLGQRDQHKSSPYQLAGTTWSALAGGYRVFWATKTDGSLWAWGQNSKGQLANNNPSNYLRSSPTQIAGETWATGQASLSGNMNGAMCMRTGNKLFMWGEGVAGELGQNDRADQSSPVQVPGTQWVQAARWRDSSAGIKNTLL